MINLKTTNGNGKIEATSMSLEEALRSGQTEEEIRKTFEEALQHSMDTIAKEKVAKQEKEKEKERKEAEIAEAREELTTAMINYFFAAGILDGDGLEEEDIEDINKEIVNTLKNFEKNFTCSIKLFKDVVNCGNSVKKNNEGKEKEKEDIARMRDIMKRMKPTASTGIGDEWATDIIKKFLRSL